MFFVTAVDSAQFSNSKAIAIILIIIVVVDYYWCAMKKKLGRIAGQGLCAQKSNRMIFIYRNNWKRFLDNMFFEQCFG